LCATNVESGKVRIFEHHELSPDVVLASACLPFLFQAVEIDGEFFWDGGYMGNPAIFPLIYQCQSADVVIVHVNPIERKGCPTTAGEILSRLNEISFNSSLMREMRAIAFVSNLIERGKVAQNEMKAMRIHSIRSDATMAQFGVASKMDTSWPLLQKLQSSGSELAQQWLVDHFSALGVRSSVDFNREFL
jgi:NTE family protein